MSKVLKDMEKFKKQVEQIHASFEEAKQRAEAEITDLKVQINEMESNTHELYKSFVLGEISSDAYEAEKAELDKLKKQLQASEKKVADIDVLKIEELQRVHHENKSLVSKYTKEKEAIVAEQRAKIIELKHMYLLAVSKEAEAIKDVQKYQHFLGELAVDCNYKDYSYERLHDATVLKGSSFNGKVEGAEVSFSEIESAFKRNV
ncbi:hypothetical protein BKP35_10420 [Anaerobacillus arseniciselenatis]|uniref:Uncharacterized protein n=1 Tax=Anaerobacillus arseniciselenatis TaxID=85682 RepID=A0A1S2LNG5_9BACI|nr:hypothetical protein [Anaerobacillus arseniciselenatis]OIJ12965.1 hypothetical protein BKP35_10420 [Anaerobacillus arseniciselenatis]